MNQEFKIPGGVKYIVGIDEVGRGPLAGPLVICAVALPRTSKYNKTFLKDFFDSKKLKSDKRLELSVRAKKALKQGRINFSISSVSPSFIDRNGLSKAIKRAIEKSLKNLNLPPNKCLVLLDGSLKAPPEYLFQKTIIKGDEKIKIISCASVIAKVSRDRFMTKMDKKYSKYNFCQNKGYGTSEHLSLIKTHGLCEIHRRSFTKNILIDTK